MKHKILGAAVLAAVLLAASCSSGDSDRSSVAPTTTTTSQEATTASSVAAPPASAEPYQTETPEDLSVVVPFTTGNGEGTITISGDDSPVAVWFSSQPGEISLDLIDADATDGTSVVEEVVGFWFFSDDDSGDVPPSIFESSVGGIIDSVGTRYVVAAELLGPAPGTETTTTTSTTSTSTTAAFATSSVPDEETGTSEAPSTTSTTSTTTSTTTTVVSPVTLQVQVLNGSGVAGAAGRMTDKLSQAGYAVLSPENAPQRYATSAVYYADGWKDKAEEILETAEIGEIDGVTAMPQQFASEDAAVVVLLGTDTAPAVVREQAGLRPRPNFDVKLPLGDDVPRDRFVPGLANIQIFSRVNDEQEYIGRLIHTLQGWIGQVGNYAPDYIFGVGPHQRESREDLETGYRVIEEILIELGFTPQNVCGAPAGYSFRDLLEPTREWSESTMTYQGDAIFTTDRLIELHGGTRINPESNLDFYIRQAVQTAHDMLRLPELLDETEAPQLVLCAAWLAPSGEVPEFSNAAWYALLTPGIQPQESLLSQGTYHVKEISRNGNFAYLVVCHPTIGARFVLLHWREAGYRAEIVEDVRTSGCQAAFEEYDDFFAGQAPSGSGAYFEEDTITFSFGERVFSASDMQEFPRN